MSIQLKFRDEQTFTIVQLTDVHWHNGEPEDLLSRRLMEMVVEKEKPDLVALTGDIVAGGGCKDARRSLQQVVEVFEERKIPWAMVFGNHDDEGDASREALMEVQTACAMSLSEPGPSDIFGVGNYILRIHSAQANRIAAALYFIDSGGYAQTSVGGYDWIKRDQIEWYISESRALTAAAGKPLPALAFFHIPIPEYDEVWDFHACYGVKYENVCAPRINTGFFAAMHEMGDVMGTFVGHDHINDYWGDLHGIRLCYGRGSGYNTYGRNGFQRGGRIIRLKEGGRGFDSWLRLADGSVVEEQPEHAPMKRVLTEG
jgi:3',5'-cyclic AMP phosphodiesterase CpdA